MRLSVIISLLSIASLEPVLAQNAYSKLGAQSYYNGDFKTAVRQLEKAYLVDSTNATALWMLGYSYYHSDNFVKAINAFNRVLVITPADGEAYYFRALAKTRLGKDVQLPLAEREKYWQQAIFDYTKAIEINAGKMSSCYQNRGLTYREYGLFKLDANQPRTYDKTKGIKALYAAVDDLKKVLNDNTGRADIATLLDQTKEKLATLTGHH